MNTRLSDRFGSNCDGRRLAARAQTRRSLNGQLQAVALKRQFAEKQTFV